MNYVLTGLASSHKDKINSNRQINLKSDLFF